MTTNEATAEVKRLCLQAVLVIGDAMPDYIAIAALETQLVRLVTGLTGGVQSGTVVEP